jgi:uncharacterized protein YukE
MTPRQVQALESQLAVLSSEFENFRKESAEHRDQSRADLADLTGQIKGLVEAWQTAQGVVRFVKWLSGLLTALAVVYAALKGLDIK